MRGLCNTRLQKKLLTYSMYYLCCVWFPSIKLCVPADFVPHVLQEYFEINTHVSIDCLPFCWMPPIWSCWLGAAFVSVHLETKLVLFDCRFLTHHQKNPSIFLWTCKHSLEKHNFLLKSQICNNTPLPERGNWLDTENCLFTFIFSFFYL